jgi:hypothetical protein
MSSYFDSLEGKEQVLLDKLVDVKTQENAAAGQQLVNHVI